MPAMPPIAIRPELARRIVQEADAIRERFPGRFRLILDSAGRPSWVGSVPIEGRDFPVAVTYPAAYPAMSPTLEALLDLPLTCPHVLARAPGRCKFCWLAWDVADRKRRRWDPQRHTAATALRAAQRWGLAFLVWQTVGAWPVPDAFEERP
jgi:hypothetical protein